MGYLAPNYNDIYTAWFSHDIQNNYSLIHPPPENNSTYLLLHRQAEQAGYTYWAISLNFTLEEKYENYFFTFNSYFSLRLCFVVQ